MDNTSKILAIICGFLIVGILYAADSAYDKGFYAGKNDSDYELEYNAIFEQGYHKGFDVGYDMGYDKAYENMTNED